MDQYGAYQSRCLQVRIYFFGSTHIHLLPLQMSFHVITSQIKWADETCELKARFISLVTTLCKTTKVIPERMNSCRSMLMLQYIYNYI